MVVRCLLMFLANTAYLKFLIHLKQNEHDENKPPYYHVMISILMVEPGCRIVEGLTQNRDHLLLEWSLYLPSSTAQG